MKTKKNYKQLYITNFNMLVRDTKGTMSYSLQEGGQLCYLGCAGGAVVGTSQFSPRHMAGNLPCNCPDSVNSLEP